MDDLLHFSRVVLPSAVPRFNISSPAVERGSNGRGGASATSDTTRLSAVDTAAPASGGRSTWGRREGDNRPTATVGGGIGAAEASSVGVGGSGGDNESGENAAAGSRLDISVVAHSMGGLTAVYAALEDPLLFKGVRRYFFGFKG